MSGNGHTPTITGWQLSREVLVRHSEDQPCPLVDDWVRGSTGGTVEVSIPGFRGEMSLESSNLYKVSTSVDVSVVLN